MAGDPSIQRLDDTFRNSKGDPVSGFWSIRRFVAGTMVLAVAASAVTLFGQTTAPASAPASAPSITSTGPAMPAGVTIPSLDEPIATINGKPINNRVFYAIMMNVSGVRVFQQVADLLLVQDACDNAGIPMSGTDFNKRMTEELNRIMDGMGITSTKTKAEEALAERVNTLNAVLQQRGLTAVEFRIGQETQCLLRALAEGRVTQPTDQDVKDAWESQYGEQRQIHLIWFDPAQQPGVVRIKEVLKSAKTVEDAATELKLNTRAFVIPKNAQVDDSFKPIKTIAFDQLKVAKDVSADVEVMAGTAKQHVLVVLDEIIKDKRDDNKFDKVKSDVAKKVFDAKQAQWMNDRLMNLRAKSVIDIKDPTLAQINKNILDAYRNSATSQPADTAPATAPASAPATAPATTSRPAVR